MRVAVVGAGVLGASVAWHLLRGGAEVTMLDSGGPGSGTSSRGAGLVCEGMWHPTSLALVRRSAELLRRLSAQGEEEGHPFRFQEVGSTTLVPAEKADAARKMGATQRSLGATVEVLTPREAGALPRHELVSMEGVEVALHYPRDGWAMPRMYCELLWMAGASMGLQASTKSARIVRGGERIAVEGVEADHVVLAAGVWTRALLAQVGLDAPLTPYRTQAQRYRHPRGDELPILHDGTQGFYLRPSWPGQLLVGNGTTTTAEDPARWRMEADDAFVAASTRRLRQRIPSMVDAEPTEGWAGLDAATPDRLLLAGPHPEAPNLWLLAGGNGHGFMRAPAAGESLAARMLGKTPKVDLGAYDPARFATSWRDPFPIREGYTLEP